MTQFTKFLWLVVAQAHRHNSERALDLGLYLAAFLEVESSNVALYLYVNQLAALIAGRN